MSSDPSSKTHPVVAPDLEVQIPKGWQDQGYIAWAQPLKEGETVAPNVVISRSELRPDQSLDAYATEQLNELMNAGEEFVLVSKTSAAWKRHPSVRVRFDWAVQGNEFSQEQVYIERPSKNVVNVTFTTARNKFEESEATFAQVLDSLELTEPVDL